MEAADAEVPTNSVADAGLCRVPVRPALLLSTDPQIGTRLGSLLQAPWNRVLESIAALYEQAVSESISYIQSRALTPIRRIQTIQHVRNLRQFVRLTGLGSPGFERTGSAFEKVVELFKGTLRTDMMTGAEDRMYEGDPAIDCHARYFTDRELVPQEKHQPFDEVVDPYHILEDIRGTSFIHGPDNKVEYLKKTTEEGETTYTPMDPINVCEGDIVEVTVAFVCVPIKNSQYRFLTALRAIAHISSVVREAADMQREKASAILMPQIHTPRVLKRKKLFSQEEKRAKRGRGSENGIMQLEMRVDDE
ncbi:hypothetical protein CC2G_004782 [Coprinopsis cinerea AmutBmut pab1-1]|nr:hypothetical protein CC2G_004782 [Coprinopsis cinerea AmutBmut pab1-1]